ncbi:MAG TPA: hypothetical protein VNS58_25755 [Puia sp.]|nr:hypothetical protein [Puia sp.]
MQYRTEGIWTVDIVQAATVYLPFDEKNIDFPIYYIGLPKDTIRIGRCYWRGRTPWTNPQWLAISRKHYDQTLEIQVDTTVRTTSTLEYWYEDGQVNPDSSLHYHAFALTVKNKSDSAVFMGRAFSLYFMRREVKDRSGRWVRIGKTLYELGICGSGEPRIYLNPGEIILSKLRRSRGHFVTDCRLVFGYEDNVVYSNVYRDSVDERIF